MVQGLQVCLDRPKSAQGGMGFDRPAIGTKRPWRRDFVLSALCVAGLIKASGAFIAPFTRSARARPVAGPQLPQTQDFPLRPAHEPSQPLPFPSLYPLLSTASPSPPPPKTAAPLHLSILELLKATIGLSSGPWGLPVSNSSVVRLMVSREVWNETEPWRRYPMGFRRPVSSGFVVDVGKRYIITAQHVLHSAFRITASRPAGNGISPAHPGEKQGPEYRARVLCESAEWDLALLTVDEDDFWTAPLEALPLNSEVTVKPEALVTVAGYRNRSLTTDEWMVQGYERGPACLNLDLYRPGEQWESRQVMPFGCSGGPVLALHKKAYTVVGMLSAGQPDRPLLHTVPAPLIQRFIQFYEEQGQFPGACQPGFHYQPLKSRYLREKVGVGMSGDGGVVVTKVEEWGGQTALKQGDVIIEIDGLTVDEEGRVMTLPPDRFHVGLSGLWDVGKREGDPVTYKVYRPGVGTLTLQGTAKQCSALVPLHAPPKQYLLVGGLLFLPASQMKLQEAQARAQSAPVELQQWLKAEPRTYVDEQALLLWRIYPHEINEGYVERLSRLVSFNGQRVVNMAHLQTLVDTALEESTWLEFEMDDASQRHIVLPSFAAKATDNEIRKANRIPPPRPVMMDEKEEEEEDYEDDDDVIIL